MTNPEPNKPTPKTNVEKSARPHEGDDRKEGKEKADEKKGQKDAAVKPERKH